MSSFIVADRVQETCNAPGLGVVTLLGASPQFQSFSATIGNTNTTTYAIADVVGINWEVGIGTYSSSGNTLTRTTVLASSNGGAAVNFSSGTQNVWVDYPAEYAVYASNNSSQILGQALISSGVGVAPTWGNINSTVGSPGYYGSFYDTTNQAAASTTIAYVVNIGSTFQSNQVSINSGNQITFLYAGVYNLQYSIQFINTNTGSSNNDNVDVWLRKNGTDVADSNSVYNIPSRKGSTDGANLAVVNYVLSVNAGDYLQLAWAVTNTTISIATLAAASSPTVPRTPGVIVTATPVTQIGIGYYGLTSATSTLIATGSKTLTTNLSATSTAFTVGTRVRVAYSTTPANYMEGVITAFTGTTLTVLVDSLGGSGTFASWTISVAGIQGSNGVTSFSGNSTGLTPSTATTGAISLGGTLNVANGGTGVTTSTGTGSVVLSATPTFTGTLNAANISYTGTLTGSTGVLNIGSGQIYKDASGNVGLGNTTPSSFDSTGKPLVVGSGSGNQGITIYAGTTGYSSVNFADGTTGTDRYSGQVSYDHTNNALLFATNTGADRMRIDSSGNVGIGVIPSAGLGALQVTTVTNGTAAKLGNGAFINSFNGDGFLSGSASLDSSGVWTARSTGSSSLSATSAGTILFYTNSGLTNGSTFSPTERMRIDSSGNVGIGTSSPTTKLVVGSIATGTTDSTYKGNIKIEGTETTLESQGGLEFKTTSDGYGAKIQTLSSGGTNLVFATRNNSASWTERMRIDSSGNLLVGATSQFGAGKVCVSYDGTVYNGVALRTTNAALNSNFVTFYNSATTNCGGISQNGTTTVNYITSSDYRLKENIAPMIGALDKVVNLNPVTYIWKDTDNEAGEGFIAHELQALCPLAVSGEKDAVNEDGSIKAQGIDPSKLVALLTASIQELKAIIDTQQEQINSLLGK